jgi:hypothetical protein
LPALSVLHHLQAVLVRDGEDGRHVGRQARIVHRHDGLGARRDRVLDRPRRDAQRLRVDVHQHHVRAEVAHHLGRGGEGVRGGDHLVAGPDAQRLQRQVQAGGGRVHCDRLERRVAQVFGECGLETLGLGPGGDPAGFEGVDDFGDFLVADLGQRERKKGLGNGVHGA